MIYHVIKRIFFLITLSLLSHATVQAFHPVSYTYCLKIAYDPQDSVHIKGTYKGDIIDLKDGIGFLPETHEVNSFELIIIAEHPKMSAGIMPHLERDPDISCMWYDISWKKSGTKTIWHISKRPEESLPTRIPNNALIICYPPEFVEKIEDRIPQESSGTIIHLPKIILKKNLSQEEKKQRDNQLTRSALADLDVRNALSCPTDLVKKGNKVMQALKAS